MGERIFLLLCVFVLMPRWVFRIQSPWLLLAEVPVLVVLVVMAVKKLMEIRRAGGS